MALHSVTGATGISVITVLCWRAGAPTPTLAIGSVAALLKLTRLQSLVQHPGQGLPRTAGLLQHPGQGLPRTAGLLQHPGQGLPRTAGLLQHPGQGLPRTTGLVQHPGQGLPRTAGRLQHPGQGLLRTVGPVADCQGEMSSLCGVGLRCFCFCSCCLAFMHSVPIMRACCLGLSQYVL